MTTQPALVSDDDHVALSRLVTEIVWRIDHGLASTVHELFTADGTMAIGGMKMAGRSELEAWGANRDAMSRRTRHVCSDHRFVTTGPGTAEGTTTITVYLHDGPGDGAAVPMAIGEYQDRFVNRDGRWLFSARRIERLFTDPRA